MIDILILATILFTGMRLIPGKHWLLKLPVYLALQTSVLLVILLSAKLFFSDQLSPWDMALYSIGLVIIIWQSIDFLPFLHSRNVTVPHCRGDHEESRIKFLVINVLISNEKYKTLLSTMQATDADVVGLLETNARWIKETTTFITEEQYPYQVILPREDGYGMCLLSKYPIEVKKVFRIYNSTPALYFLLNFKSTEISCFLLHPKPPILPEAETSLPKDREFEELGEFIGKMNNDEKVVVFGDLNDVAWSPTTTKFLIDSGLLDPRRGRGIMPTFPTWAPLFGFPLDQIFISRHFKVHELEALPDVGSDHFPFKIDLCLRTATG